jgi:hypothetical protein
MALLWQTLAIKKKLSMVVVMFASKCLDNPLHFAILSKKGIFFRNVAVLTVCATPRSSVVTRNDNKYRNELSKSHMKYSYVQLRKVY